MRINKVFHNFIFIFLITFLFIDISLSAQSNIQNDTSSKLNLILKRLEGKKHLRYQEAKKFKISLPSQQETINKSNIPTSYDSNNEVIKIKKEVTKSINEPKIYSFSSESIKDDNNFLQNSKLTEILAKISARRSRRYDEARKLNIVLPSQGGQFPHMFPKLKAMNEFINHLISNKSLPSNTNVNFGFYP